LFQHSFNINNTKFEFNQLRSTQSFFNCLIKVKFLIIDWINYSKVCVGWCIRPENIHNWRYSELTSIFFCLFSEQGNFYRPYLIPKKKYIQISCFNAYLQSQHQTKTLYLFNLERILFLWCGNCIMTEQRSRKKLFCGELCQWSFSKSFADFISKNRQSEGTIIHGRFFNWKSVVNRLNRWTVYYYYTYYN
jgi:hypothetical protein